MKGHDAVTEIVRAAARQGNRDAQYLLGFMYERGYGVPQSDKEGAQWYRWGAEQGDSQCQVRLGTLYREVLREESRAAQWYRRGAEQGDPQARRVLEGFENPGSFFFPD